MSKEQKKCYDKTCQYNPVYDQNMKLTYFIYCKIDSQNKEI